MNPNWRAGWGRLLALCLVGCQGYEYEAKDYAAMNSIPLKPVCLGRLQIELPRKGALQWGATFDRSEVTRLGNPAPDERSFWELVEKRKNELESLPHETEPSQLGLYQRVGDNAAILLYRDSDHRTGSYKMDRYLWLGSVGYYFQTGVWPNEIRNEVQHNSQIFTKLVPHDTIGLPQSPGFCIDGATVTGNIGDISANISVEVPGANGVSLAVGTGEDGPPAPPSDIQYEVEAPRSAFEHLDNYKAGYAEQAKRDDEEAVVSFDILRKRERALAGFAGQETAFKVKLQNGQLRYRFEWQTEFEGAATPQQPGISIELIAGSDQLDSSYAAPPPKEDMFALWDAVLASLKPRPGA